VDKLAEELRKAGLPE